MVGQALGAGIADDDRCLAGHDLDDGRRCRGGSGRPPSSSGQQHAKPGHGDVPRAAHEATSGSAGIELPAVGTHTNPTGAHRRSGAGGPGSGGYSRSRGSLVRYRPATIGDPPSGRPARVHDLLS